MLLETLRLELLPLTARQLELWIENTPALERELLCTYDAEPLEGFFLDILSGQLAATRADETNYLYHSFWLILRKSDRVIVGSADFKRPPNTEGEVEIGYGLGKAHEHNGYMTETVGAMCQWALRQPGVKHVIAETEHGNPASEHVLERCSFVKYKEAETNWWRL